MNAIELLRQTDSVTRVLEATRMSRASSLTFNLPERLSKAVQLESQKPYASAAI